MVNETADWKHVQRQFPIEPGVIYMNNGSFGPCPTPVIETALEYYRTLETNPQRFISEYRGLVDEEKSLLASFVGAKPGDIVFITNVTVGMNMIANGLRTLAAGDEIVITDQEYGAVRNIWNYTAGRRGLKVKTVEIPTPPDAPEQVVELIRTACTEATKIVVMSHITSPTGTIFPVAEVSRFAAERGIYTAIDGAHAPGMIDVDIDALGCDFYTGNCHKWLCAPKGSGFLYARPDRQTELDPLIVGWGWKQGEETFLGNFENPGTHNPSMYLGTGAAIRFQQEIGPEAITARDVALSNLLRERLESIPGARLLTSKSADLSCAMTTVELSAHDPAALRDAVTKRNIVLPGIGGDGHARTRISTHIYNDEGHIDMLMEAIEETSGSAT